MLTVKRNEVVNLFQANKDRIFTVLFTKKDNTLREMNCRLGVKKHLKGGVKKYNPIDYNLLGVFDMQKKGYRTINLSTLKTIALNKKVYTVV